MLALPALLAVGCNGPLLPDPAVRYIAFGDSSTAGPASINYWQYLQQDLDQPPAAFVSQGKGGETTAEGLPRLQDLLDREIYPNAQVLLFWEGGGDILGFIRDHDPLLATSPNDSDYPFADDLAAALDQTQANIEQAIDRAQQAGLQVYVATYYYLAPGQCRPALLNVLLPEQANRANEYVRLLNERIRHAADNAGARLVEVGAQAEILAADLANYFDCNHLSEKGNRAVANLFLQAIRP